MNPTILKLMSSLLSCNESGTVKPLKSGKRDGHFLTNMLKALHTSQKKSCCMFKESNIMGMNSNRIYMGSNKVPMCPNEKGYKFYIESLKKELLAHGKPLDKILLKENDLPLIKTFLFQCGFSTEKVENFLKDVKTSNPTGEISLSRLFFKIAELGSPKSKEQQSETVPPSAIPYIESVLRDFDFTSKELESVFSGAKVEGGGLDLDKVVIKLKEISSKRPSVNKVLVDQSKSGQISEMMEMIGIHMDNKGKNGQISLENFIASLEQLTGNVNTENQVPSEIKRTLDRILERVMSSEQKPVASSPVEVSSNYDFTKSLVKEKIDGKSNALLHKKKISPSGKSKSGEGDAIFYFIKHKDSKVVHQGQTDTDTSNPAGKNNLLSDFGEKIEFINSIKENGHTAKTDIEKVNAPRNATTFNLADAVKTAEYGEKISRGYLPASLVDQVGKQISRSILRGDQVLRLQLKPPELGRIEIKIDVKDHTLKLAMITEHHSVKELMLNNVHELKEALLHQGVKLEKLDVQINYNFNQSLNASKEGTDNRHEWRNGLNGDQFNSDNHTEVSNARSINIVSGDNLLDLVA